LQPPNILLITSDQHHYSALGATNPSIRTPALDRLCREGTRFDRAYCPNPTCTPTRASILTGMYPSQHGAWTLGTKLFEDVPTVGDMLHEKDYFTGLAGKAHLQPLASRPGMTSIECPPTLRDLDFWRGFHGPWYGFEQVETARMHGCEGWAGGHYAIWMEEKGLKNWPDYFIAENNRCITDEQRALEASRTWALPQEFHYTTWTGEKIREQIRQAAGARRPFFIWASFHDPHPPYVVSEPWASRYNPEDMEPGQIAEGEHDRNPRHFQKTQERDRAWWAQESKDEGSYVHGGHSHLHDRAELKQDMACYYGMVSFMDKEIGGILEELDRLGLAENTIVIFTSDHGHFLGQHGLIAKAIHMYEDLLRIPFIIRWPGRVPADAISSALQNLVDLAPTFLDAAGLEIPGLMTGLNQLPTWCGGAPTRTWSITENHHGRRRFHMRTYVNERYKITVYRNGAEGELFDLVADPNELHNLWDEAAATALKAQLLHEFMQATLQSEPERMPRIAGA